MVTGRSNDRFRVSRYEGELVSFCILFTYYCTQICIWEPSTGYVINTIYGHTDTVKDVVFNPQTENVALPILASAGDFSIHISDPRPTQRADLLTLSPHLSGKEVEAVDISPDGSLLVSGGRDGCIALMTLFVPSLVPYARQSSASILQKSRTSRNRSYIYDATVDDISEVDSEIFEDDLQAELEADALDSILVNRSAVNRNTSKMSAVAKMKRMSRLGEKEVDLDDHATVKRKGPSARESRGKRLKQKAVDIPTMIAHLTATNRRFTGPGLDESSSGSESEDDGQDVKEDLLVKVSSRVNKYSGLNRKTLTQEAIQRPPAPKLALLPDGAVGKLKHNRELFEKHELDELIEEEEEEATEDQPKSKVKLDEIEYAPSENTVSDNIADDEYYATLLPGELESPRHLARDDSMNFDTESLMQSGKYLLSSPDYILNSSLRFEDFTNNRELLTSSPIDAASPSHTAHGKKHFAPTLVPALEEAEEAEDNFADELGSGDEYGDNIPLSMI